MSKLAKLPPALPRGDRADWPSKNRGLNSIGALGLTGERACYQSALFAFPGGQLRQGTVCEGASPDAGPSEGSGYGPGALSAVRVACRPQTVKIPAALLTPHHKAGTAGPQTNPPQGGGQLLSLADSSLKYRPATLTAGQITVLSANSVMPCGGVDSDTLGYHGSEARKGGWENGLATANLASRVQFPARMAPVWRFLCQ